MDKYNDHYIRPNKLYKTEGCVPETAKKQYPRPLHLDRKVADNLSLDEVLDLACDALGDSLLTAPENPRWVDPLPEIGPYRGVRDQLFHDMVNANGLTMDEYWIEIVGGDTNRCLEKLYLFHLKVSMVVSDALDAGVGVAAFLAAGPEPWRQEFGNVWPYI